MSRRQTVLTILLFAAIAIAGFIFGRVILPCLILRNMETKTESSELMWPRDDNRKLALVAALDRSIYESAEGNQIGEKSLSTGDNPSPQEQQTGREPRFIAEPEDIVIDVDVTLQAVKVIKDQEVLKEMIASTGVEGHETPLGTFEIQNRGTWFYSEKYKQGARYWVSFRDWGLYLFHSVAMDKNQNVIPEEEAKLGEPASHGCVRLKIEDAKWIYDNVPEKAKVVIHK
ncbi:MAG: L,D-transpeptidase [Bacillota bacterium]